MPFLLLPIGFSPGHRCRLCNRCLGRAVVCNAVRLAGVGYPGQAPARGRPGQPRRLFLQLGVCALRRPHKLRVCQDLLFQGRGPCTANLSIGYRPLGPALLVSHDSQKLPLIPASLGPTNLAGQNLAKENRLGAPYFWGHPRFPKGAYKTVHRGLPIGPTEQPKNIGQNLCRLSLCLPPLAHNVLHGVRTRVHIQGYSMTHGTLVCCSDSEIRKFCVWLPGWAGTMQQYCCALWRQLQGSCCCLQPCQAVFQVPKSLVTTMKKRKGRGWGCRQPPTGPNFQVCLEAGKEYPGMVSIKKLMGCPAHSINSCQGCQVFWVWDSVFWVWRPLKT